ncbi:hypothetical protein LCGC14_2758440, partial [marine sediment metagenome]
RKVSPSVRMDAAVSEAITTDVTKPKLLDDVVLWANWTQINKWLEEYSKKNPLLEFLCENFDKLLRNKKLITEEWNAKKNERVLIVAGCSFGEDVALKCNKYFCQNNRSFRPSGFIAFYCNKQIRYCYEINQTPKDDQYLLEYDDFVVYFKDKMMVDDENKILDEKYNWILKPNKVVELGPLINLNRIEHHKDSAFTQNQRYTKIELLKNARTTDEL